MSFNLNNKKIVIISLAVILLLAVGSTVIAIMVYKAHVTSNQLSQSSNSGYVGDAVIASFKDASVVPSMKDTYVVASDSEREKAHIDTVYFAKSGSFATSVPATSSAIAYQKDASRSENSSAIASDVQALMKKYNLAATSESSTNTVVKLYKNDTTICQIMSISNLSNKGAAIGVSCVSMATITNKYAEIDSLMTHYTGSVTLSNATSVYVDSVVQGSMKLSTLRVYQKDDTVSKRLYFAMATDTWEYIGELPLRVSGSSSARIPASMQKKMADKKYGNFLINNIQG